MLGIQTRNLTKPSSFGSQALSRELTFPDFHSREIPSPLKESQFETCPFYSSSSSSHDTFDLSNTFSLNDSISLHGFPPLPLPNHSSNSELDTISLHGFPPLPLPSAVNAFDISPTRVSFAEDFQPVNYHVNVERPRNKGRSNKKFPKPIIEILYSHLLQFSGSLKSCPPKEPSHPLVQRIVSEIRRAVEGSGELKAKFEPLNPQQVISWLQNGYLRYVVHDRVPLALRRHATDQKANRQWTRASSSAVAQSPLTPSPLYSPGEALFLEEDMFLTKAIRPGSAIMDSGTATLSGDFWFDNETQPLTF